MVTKEGNTIEVISAATGVWKTNAVPNKDLSILHTVVSMRLKIILIDPPFFQDGHCADLVTPGPGKRGRVPRVCSSLFLFTKIQEHLQCMFTTLRVENGGRWCSPARGPKANGTEDPPASPVPKASPKRDRAKESQQQQKKLLQGKLLPKKQETRKKKMHSRNLLFDKKMLV